MNTNRTIPMLIASAAVPCPTTSHGDDPASRRPPALALTIAVISARIAARDSAVDEAAEELFPELTQRSVTSATDREGWLRGRATADLAPLHRRREVADDNSQFGPGGPDSRT